MPENQLNSDNNDDYLDTLCNGGKETRRYSFGVRYIQTLLMFLTMTSIYILRSQFGVTIVAMTKGQLSTRPYNSGNTTADLHSHDTIDTTPTSWNIYRTYNWTKSEQEIVLNSFNLGYAIMVFPLGLLTQRWGYKLSVQGALLVNVLISMPAPWLAVWMGWRGLCVYRLVVGMSQCVMYPAVLLFLAAWVPLKERGNLGNIIHNGHSIGTVIGFQLSGFLSDSSLGWPAVFWITGLISLVTFAAVTIFGVTYPSQHKTISKYEKKYIHDNIGQFKKRRKTPWKAIYTSKYSWNGFLAQIGSAVTSFFCLYQFPTYMDHVLGVNIKNNGILSSLPYVVSIVFGCLLGLACDFCARKKLLSIINIRRISNSIAAFGIILCFGTASFTKNVACTVTLFVTAVSTYAGIQTGWMLNLVDIAPNYSGLLMSTGSVISMCSSLLVSTLISYVIVDMSDILQWRIVFMAVAALVFISNTVFCVFITTERQPWNQYGDDELWEPSNTKTMEEQIKLNVSNK